MNTTTSWRGVLTLLVTAFEVDGALDLNALVANLEWLFARGANASNTVLLAAGSGGDFTSVNLAERQQVIKTVAEVNAGRTPLIAGVQALDIRDCIALCQSCERVGRRRGADLGQWRSHVALPTSTLNAEGVDA
jgi:4-hydroxy-tetrahydrodipicolinate synthase